MAEKSEESDNKDGNHKCNYEYRSDEYKGDQCPHKTLPGKDVCYWHNQNNGKDVNNDIGSDLSGMDLREAYFGEANLQKINLSNVNLKYSNLSRANLRNAVLKEANLQHSQMGHTILVGANLIEANLEKALCPIINLTNADLRNANLSETNLQQANMDMANLKEANLHRAHLIHASLNGTNLQKCNLSYADLSNANLTGAKLQGCSLIGTKLTRTNLSNANFQFAIMYRSNFNKANFIDININDFSKIGEEKGKRYSEAEYTYRELKKYFKENGMYEKSGHFYYREMVMKRKQHWQKHNTKWFGNWLGCLLCGYGEKIERVIFSSIFIIFFFGTLYYWSNSLTQNGESIAWWRNYYFSVITFTTLGIGDIQPIQSNPNVQIAIMIEAFIGAFMIALFVLTVGRKMMR